MQTILVPISENAERASRIEEAVKRVPFDRENVRAVVLNVFEEFEVESTQWSDVSSADFYDEEFPEVPAEVAANLEDAGFTVDVRREHGEPSEVILDVADELDADSIVMAGRERSPVGKALFGSTIQAVILGADAPVVVGTSAD